MFVILFNSCLMTVMPSCQFYCCGKRKQFDNSVASQLHYLL